METGKKLPKLAVIGFAIGAIFLFVVLIFFFSNGLPRPPGSSNTQSRSFIPIGEVSKVPSAAVPSTWQTYAGKKLTISFPSDWRVQENSLPEGAEVKISPIRIPLGAGDLYAVIDIFPTTYVSVAAKKSAMRTFGFRESEGHIAQYLASQFTNAVLLPSEVFPALPFQQTFYVFEHSDDTVVAGYEYQAESADAEMEKLFSRILATFALK